MAFKTVEITNDTGLHTRPGNEFVTVAKTFESKIEVENEAGKKVKGTSLLKLLSLGIKKGTNVTVHAEGTDADVAVEKLTDLLANLRD
ncbi:MULTISPECIES: HPr family phosphocarrier protein [Psychrilyobacter]|uniref:Phosphocarrier protein HPr n=1 Tax=Psychrilyobacter piezotolerans TaxID=2293438 RepID=A0ABX9KFK4_9FUSO|nr:MULTISPECIES: HPr family phosphocarrier protein [Psychrilyobacter]MCS5421383.1 HPr family phosphocarrier protein [Psychrilyobacter sp. S5]NDI78469.1 HPr family phosphocarrier protein [Psychrilyobacter piezotolerans]RDE60654.1 HPr family phosphocarrier protein [Psychrilyobacter sp. S5]REI40581.1 HPr family phosphocarrier protein [Psychrilyobacter piezotolerans]